MADAEIYVDGIAASRFRDLNAMLKAIRSDLIRQYQSEMDDHIMETLEVAQIDEGDFFCHVAAVLIAYLFARHINLAYNFSESSNTFITPVSMKYWMRFAYHQSPILT